MLLGDLGCTVLGRVMLNCVIVFELVCFNCRLLLTKLFYCWRADKGLVCQCLFIPDTSMCCVWLSVNTCMKQRGCCVCMLCDVTGSTLGFVTLCNDCRDRACFLAGSGVVKSCWLPLLSAGLQQHLKNHSQVHICLTHGSADLNSSTLKVLFLYLMEVKCSNVL